MMRARVVLRVLVVASAFVCSLGAGCRRDDPALRDARLVVSAFEAVMQAPAAQRAPGIDRLAALTPTDAPARTARDRCVALFRALSQADALEVEVRRLADSMERRTREGLLIPADEHAAVLAVHASASRAADTAERALPECTRAIDELRLRHLRTR